MQLTKQIMKEYIITLVQNEKSRATIEKYKRDIKRFYQYLPDDKSLEKERVQEWKEELIRQGYHAASINSMLAAVNGILSFLNRRDCRVKLLKLQKMTFSDDSRELSREEYVRLVQAARQKKNTRLELILETICSTGIRVSELQFITVEAVRLCHADIMLKGKCRRILLPKELVKKLKIYIKEKYLDSGCIFQTKNGKPVSRHQIWAEMKAICSIAKVARSKVFPHNLRHLFARLFYALDRDIAKLADVLGHSNIETTRLYIITSSNEHLKLLNRMKLIL